MKSFDDLYEEMRDALRYLGVKWGDKHLVKASIVEGVLTLSHWGRSVSITFNSAE